MYVSETIKYNVRVLLRSILQQVLNYLSQATSGGLNSIAGFHPVQELDGERKAQQWTRERDLECGFGYGYSVGTNYSNDTAATGR